MLKILLVYDDFQELTSVDLMLKKIGFDVVGVTSEFSLADQLLSFNPHVVVAQGKSAKVTTVSVGRRLREALRWDGKSVLIFYPQNRPQPQDILRARMDIGLEYPVEPTRLVQVLAGIGNLDSSQLLDRLIRNMAQEAAAVAAQNFAVEPESESVHVKGRVGTEMPDPVTVKSKSQPSDTVADSQDQKLERVQVDGSVPAPPGEAPAEAADVKGGVGPLAKIEPVAVVQDPILQELEKLLQPAKPGIGEVPPLSDSQRKLKYEEIIKNLAPRALASIKRRDAKSRIREMLGDSSRQDLENQDGLRREFVKALFKKEG
jgi:DNA-binding response OmpR family regulator